MFSGHPDSKITREDFAQFIDWRNTDKLDNEFGLSSLEWSDNRAFFLLATCYRDCDLYTNNAHDSSSQDLVFKFYKDEDRDDFLKDASPLHIWKISIVGDVEFNESW